MWPAPPKRLIGRGWPKLGAAWGTCSSAESLWRANWPELSRVSLVFQYRRRQRTASSPKPSRNWRWPRRMAFTGAAMVPPKSRQSRFVNTGKDRGRSMICTRLGGRGGGGGRDRFTRHYGLKLTHRGFTKNKAFYEIYRALCICLHMRPVCDPTSDVVRAQPPRRRRRARSQWGAVLGFFFRRSRDSATRSSR